MASQTLYRAFRPAVFDDVSGQEHITQILKKQIDTGQPAHAYLFCGTRGTGKTTTARILANAVNCLNPQDGNPCGECEVCRMFAEERFADVTEMDAASNSGVEHIREIREKAALLPIQGRYRVYIIDEAHMLSSGAFNALLKTLEEPPAHTIFILATTELRKIPRTITSRCQHFDFHRIANADIAARLRYVAGQIGVSAEEKALQLLAEQSDGALRDALSLLEQCSAGRTELSAEDVLRTLGLSDARQLEQLADSILDGDTAQAVASLNAILADGTAHAHVLQDLVVYLSQRLAQTAEDGANTHIVLRALNTLIEAQNTLRFSPVPQAVLLSAVVRAANTTTDVDLTHLEARLQRLEAQMERLTAGAPAAKAPPVPAPLPAEPAQASQQPVRTDPVREAPRPAAAAQSSEPAAQAEAVDPPDALERFQNGVIAANGACRPAVKAVSQLERRGTTAVLHTSSDDETIVRLLTADSERTAVLSVLSEVYGTAMDSVRVECAEPDDEDSVQQVMSALSSVFHQRVTVEND